MKLSALVLDPSAQPRASLDWTLIAEYADAIRRGDAFPPVVAFGTEEEAYLADGWHRVHAAKEAGAECIAVDRRPGGLEDAVWFSCGANATHGLKRSNQDKRTAVERALLQKPEMSDRDIARHCGVDHVTVGRVRGHLVATGEVHQSDERRGSDGRIINTANIGRRTIERCSLCHVNFEGGHVCSAAARRYEQPPIVDEDTLGYAEPIADLDGERYATLPLREVQRPSPFDLDEMADERDDDGSVARARLLAQYSAGIAAACKLGFLDPRAVVGALGRDRRVIHRENARTLRGWLDAIDRELDGADARPLQVVGGNRG